MPVLVEMPFYLLTRLSCTFPAVNSVGGYGKFSTNLIYLNVFKIAGGMANSVAFCGV